MYYHNDNKTPIGSISCCSDTIIGMHRQKPAKMYLYEYLIYHTHPFGLEKNLTEVLPKKVDLNSLLLDDYKPNIPKRRVKRRRKVAKKNKPKENAMLVKDDQKIGEQANVELQKDDQANVEPKNVEQVNIEPKNVEPVIAAPINNDQVNVAPINDDQVNVEPIIEKPKRVARRRRNRKHVRPRKK